MKDTQLSVNRAIAQSLHTATPTPIEIDTRGYDAAWISFISGAITDGTFTPSVTECDTSGGTFTAVAAADLHGTLAAMSASSVQSVGYKGTKRFIKANITVTGSPATGGYVSAIVTLSKPNLAPI